MNFRTGLLLALAAVPAAAAPLRYNRDVRPLLSDNCFHCHGPDAKTRKADLRLDIREFALQPAKSGKTAIVPGKPEASELVARIFHTDPDELMPPEEAHKTLTPSQKDLFRQWIAEGATYEAHWAYTPIVRPSVPPISNQQSKILNAIDAFIQHPLLEKGIAPSPEAGSATLFRRLSLDLTGIPPTPGETAAFVAACTGASLSTLNSQHSTQTDRLLASPQFGERMAQHWLDVVRYSDTVGFHGDQNHNAWAYRDWVINSFNENKRFDAFTREQLAGDLLPNPTESQWTATCFNRLTMMTREGGAQPGEYMAKYTADRVRTVSMAWLGATLGCAECHDHKFDPWKQKDFYSLGAYFADMKQWGVYQDYDYTPNPDLKGWTNDHPFPPERIVESDALKRRLASLTAQREKILNEAAEKLKTDPLAMGAFGAWGETFGKFLKEDPNGWVTPIPQVVDTVPPPPKSKDKAAKAEQIPNPAQPNLENPGPAQPDLENPGQRPRPTLAAIAEQTPNPAQSNLENPGPARPELENPKPAKPELENPGRRPRPKLAGGAAREPSGTPGKTAKKIGAPAGATETPAPAHEPPAVQTDGRILFAKGGARNTEITLPYSGNVSAVSIELLPDKAHNNSIARTGHSVTLRPSFHRVTTDGKTKPLPIRFADANLKRPDYANGFEVLSIQNGWISKDGSAHLPHRSIWFLELPVAFAPGDALRVTLPAHLAGCLRVSISPVITSFTTLDPFPQFGEPSDDAAVWRLFLLTSPGNTIQKSVFALDQQIRECRGGRTPVMVTERAAKPQTVRVLPRGNWQDQSGELCTPVTASFLPKDENPQPTRLGLANWLTSRTNPLTARVIMNRLWRQFFGTGLSAQTDDLGAQGEAPSHPELLDWLAAEFIESGWDMKHMVKLIVTSHTYKQSSQPRSETRESDPSNRWLASQNPRRLEAESVRDNALAIAGLLSLEMGGPPVFPYQPANYYEGLQFPDRDYLADKDTNQWRRGIYTHWQRTFLHPMLANFDAPSREDCVALRTQANTPQQALTLLNDPSYVEAARVWAAALIKSGDDKSRIDTAFQNALSRKPNAKERDGLLTFLNRMRAEYKARPEDAAKLLKTGFAPEPAASTDKVELAAWTSLCRVVLNLHETITRY